MIEGLRGVGAGDGSDFTVAIIEGDKNVLLCSFKPTSEQCQVSYDWKADRLEVTLNKPPLVNKDVKFMFTCSTKGVPVATTTVPSSSGSTHFSSRTTGS